MTTITEKFDSPHWGSIKIPGPIIIPEQDPFENLLPYEKTEPDEGP
jgi:hypothetical protein